MSWGRAFLALGAITGLFLAASCANPTSPPPGNTAPQVSFNDYEASGAGTTEVNGYYRENGASEGKPKYSQVSGAYFLFYFTSTDIGVRWAIHTSVLDNTNPITVVPYHAADTTDAPAGTWSRTVLGGNPAPAVARVAITGSLSVASVLTGVYNYSDAESDADASTYQWKRYATSTDTGAGTNCSGDGATTQGYTVDVSDNGQFLRLQVTPTDDRGATGAPVLSGAVEIDGSG